MITDVTGRVGVLTAAGSGIGRACALELARRGMSVVVTDLDGQRAKAVAAEITAEGGRALSCACDVASLTDLEAARDLAEAELGPVDFVMNNAGVLVVGEPLDIPMHEWRLALDVNVLGVVRSNEVFLPGMLHRGHGHIVNTSSTAGLYAYTYDRLAYSATKHAIVGLSEALGLYLRPRGIGVTLLCPGPVITNISEQIRYFGAPRTLRPPTLPVVTAEHVGVLVADAVRDGQFLVCTAAEVADLLRERAADPDAFFDNNARRIAGEEGLS